jgi:hypothetical protein
MAPGSVKPRSPDGPQGPRSADEISATQRDANSPGERFGPLTITRVVKDDGRALILYGHDDADSATDPETDAAGAPGPDSGREQT